MDHAAALRGERAARIVIAALAVAALSAAIVFQGVLRTTGGEPLEVATNLAYPVADLALLGLVTGGIALTG